MADTSEPLRALIDLGRVATPFWVFAGPYSNLQALEALLARARAAGIGPDQMLCLGDVCAYAGQPAETLALLRDWGCAVIAGNCEDSLGYGRADCGCGFEEGMRCSLLSIEWYRHADRAMTPPARAWMRSLPGRALLCCGERRWVAIHGGADRVNRFIFPGQSAEMLRQLTLLEAEHGPIDGVLAAHSGIAFVAELGAGDRRWQWVNVGAIGLPGHDGSTDTRFAILTADGAQLQRLRYDHHAAALAMQQVGLRGGYDRSLLTGWWPSEDILPPELRRFNAWPADDAAAPMPAPSHR